MQHKVSRAEFIKYVGVALLGIVGITSFLKNLHDNIQPVAKPASQLDGYGKSVYGR